MSRIPVIENLELRRLYAAANDTDFAQQTDLTSINVAKAWAKTTGNLNVVVADIDTGLDYTHLDLYANVWINQDEIPGNFKKHLKDVDGDGRISFYDLDSRKNRRWMTDFNANGVIDPYDILQNPRRGGWSDGVDADENGYTDDIIGWDFADNDNNPYDYVGHGTHTAGTIAARQNNNYGVAGIAQTSLMVVKIFGDDGSGGTEDQIAAAIRYSADEGARISNNSWGYTQPTFGLGFPFFGGSTVDYSDEPIYQAIQYAGEKGQIFVAAAGNDQENNDFSFNGSYPATYDLDNIVSVAAEDNAGELSYFSNYGANTVDIAAPGENVLSTWNNGDYEVESGTSMATPHVTGTLALMLARYPKLTVAQLKSDLLASVNIDSNLGGLVSGGSLNAGEAVRLAAVQRAQALGHDAGVTTTARVATAARAAASTAAASLFSTTPLTADDTDPQTLLVA